MSESQTLSPPEIAKRWGCTPESVLGLLKSGALVGFKISPPKSRRPRWRATLAAVVAYESGESQTPAAPVESLRPSQRRARARAQAGCWY
jgi:hypothetical protein